MEVNRNTEERNHKITNGAYGAAWSDALGHVTLVRKQHVGRRSHKPHLSPESLLPEHQANQTKFSKTSRTLGWSNEPIYEKEWLQGRWPGVVPVTPFSCGCGSSGAGGGGWSSRSAQTGPGTPKLGAAPWTATPVWSVSVLALCNLLLDAQLEGLSHGWLQRRVC